MIRKFRQVCGGAGGDRDEIKSLLAEFEALVVSRNVRAAQCDRCRSAPDYSDHSDPEITNTRTVKPVTCNPLETHTGHSLRVAVNLDTKTKVNVFMT